MTDAAEAPRAMVRWVRWLDRHPVVHFVGVILIWVAAFNGRATDFSPTRVVLGAVVGALWFVWFRKVVMADARRNLP